VTIDKDVLEVVYFFGPILAFVGTWIFFKVRWRFGRFERRLVWRPRTRVGVDDGASETLHILDGVGLSKDDLGRGSFVARLTVPGAAEGARVAARRHAGPDEIKSKAEARRVSVERTGPETWRIEAPSVHRSAMSLFVFGCGKEEPVIEALDDSTDVRRPTKDQGSFPRSAVLIGDFAVMFLFLTSDGVSRRSDDSLGVLLALAICLCRMIFAGFVAHLLAALRDPVRLGFLALAVRPDEVEAEVAAAPPRFLARLFASRAER
jgi:hypothetical protein